MAQPKFYVLPDGSLLPELTGGDGPKTPAPDPGLVQKQNELLQLQIDVARKGQALEPILLEEAGLRYNPETKQYEHLDPTLKSNKREIERLQTDRSLKALRGELPVSETLKRELELGKNRLHEKLYRQLGPGWELSTPGQVASREYDAMATALKEGEQRDMLTTAEALALNRGASRNLNMQTFENPFVSQARLIDPASAGLDRARGRDDATRQMGLQASMAAGQDRAGYIGAGIGALGLLASFAKVGGAAGGSAVISDPAVKEDIEPVSDAEMLAAVKRIPVKKWKYKDDPERREHIGGMADVMPPVVSDGTAFDLISYLGMLTGSIRALDKKLADVSAEPDLSPGAILAGA